MFVHLAWGALAGLAAGLVVRLRGAARLWGLAPFVLAGGTHAAYIHAIVDPLDGSVLADALLGPVHCGRRGAVALPRRTGGPAPP